MHFPLLFLTLLLTLPLTLGAPLLFGKHSYGKHSYNDKHPQNGKHSYNGDGTYYQPGLGACGSYNAATDHIVALSAAEFNNGASCGKMVRAKQAGSGDYVTAKVVDLCPGCETGCIDFSPAAFKKIGEPAQGRIKIEWEFVQPL